MTQSSKEIRKMNFQIQACSPKAERKIKSKIDMLGVDKPIDEIKKDWRKTQYPFGLLKIGECFIFTYDQKSNSCVRSLASYHSRCGKRFLVIDHSEHQCYEIARIV